jgi:hypothetical protein
LLRNTGRFTPEQAMKVTLTFCYPTIQANV